MRPTIQQLEAFLAVARTLSFRKAADETFASQSAISSAVKRLEELLGVTLFERDRRRTLLTAAGEHARAQAASILEQLDALVDSMHAIDSELPAAMRIGVIPTVAPFLVPDLVASVSKAHPETRLLVFEEPTAQLISRIQAGELDAILLDIDVEHANLTTRALIDDALLLAVDTNHPLAERERVTLAEVSELDLLLLEEAHCLSDRIRTFCRASEASSLGDFRATSLITLVHMVASGVGATLLPAMATPDFAHIPELRFVPLEDPVPHRRIGIAWRPTDKRTQAFERLADLIAGCADQPTT